MPPPGPPPVIDAIRRDRINRGAARAPAEGGPATPQAPKTGSQQPRPSSKKFATPKHGWCNRCKYGHKVLGRNDPQGDGPHAGKKRFVCSNRDQGCQFYELVEEDQTRAEDEAATEPLAPSKDGVCPQCGKGRLAEKVPNPFEFKARYLECDRKLAPERPCDFRKDIGVASTPPAVIPTPSTAIPTLAAMAAPTPTPTPQKAVVPNKAPTQRLSVAPLNMSRKRPAGPISPEATPAKKVAPPVPLFSSSTKPAATLMTPESLTKKPLSPNASVAQSVKSSAVLTSPSETVVGARSAKTMSAVGPSEGLLATGSAAGSPNPNLSKPVARRLFPTSAPRPSKNIRSAADADMETRRAFAAPSPANGPSKKRPYEPAAAGPSETRRVMVIDLTEEDAPVGRYPPPPAPPRGGKGEVAEKGKAPASGKAAAKGKAPEKGPQRKDRDASTDYSDFDLDEELIKLADKIEAPLIGRGKGRNGFRGGFRNRADIPYVCGDDPEDIADFIPPPDKGRANTDFSGFDSDNDNDFIALADTVSAAMTPTGKAPVIQLD